jgi:hypothetical protein
MLIIALVLIRRRRRIPSGPSQAEITPFNFPPNLKEIEGEEGPSRTTTQIIPSIHPSFPKRSEDTEGPVQTVQEITPIVYPSFPEENAVAEGSSQTLQEVRKLTTQEHNEASGYLQTMEPRLQVAVAVAVARLGLVSHETPPCASNNGITVYRQ